MSEIPYIFETPVPVDFRRDGWFKCDNTLKFVTWAFSRCSSKERDIIYNGKKIHLMPFQFIFGRRICSLETNMSEDEVRTQVNRMQNVGFLKNAPNKTPNRFTIYEWVTTAFSLINPQVNNQQTPNKPPTNPHNLEDKINTDYRSDDHDLIDAREHAEFDLIFEHRKHGQIKANKADIICELEDSFNSRKEIEQALEKMIKQKPVLNGTIQAYIKTILQNQKKDTSQCKTKKSQILNKPISKPKSPNNKGFYLDDDTLEAPLAKFARQHGLK